MMKKLSSLLVLLVLSVMFIRCGGSQPLPETDKMDMPEWFLNPPEDPSYFYGVATSTSKDMQLAIDKATTDARAKIAQQVDIKIQGLQKNLMKKLAQAKTAPYYNNLLKLQKLL